MDYRWIDRGRHALSGVDPKVRAPPPELATELDMQAASMNFYKHHIGDYAKKTAHLTVLEHGAYLLMLHAYYGTEKPLPFGRDLYRICRAFGKKERAAVDKVAAQFWTRTDAGYVNGRAFDEIKEASELGDIARENGKLGGRPKKPSGLSENNPAGSFLKPNGKAIQTPDSNSDSEDQGSSAVSPLPVDPRKSLWDLGVNLLGTDARSVIGQAIKRVGEPKVGEILGQMAVRPPAEPKAWFIKATQERGVVC